MSESKEQKQLRIATEVAQTAWQKIIEAAEKKCYEPLPEEYRSARAVTWADEKGAFELLDYLKSLKPDWRDDLIPEDYKNNIFEFTYKTFEDYKKETHDK